MISSKIKEETSKFKKSLNNDNVKILITKTIKKVVYSNITK